MPIKIFLNGLPHRGSADPNQPMGVKEIELLPISSSLDCPTEGQQTPILPIYNGPRDITPINIRLNGLPNKGQVGVLVLSGRPIQQTCILYCILLIFLINVCNGNTPLSFIAGNNKI